MVGCSYKFFPALKNIQNVISTRASINSIEPLPPFGAKICTNICSWTLSAPGSPMFFELCSRKTVASQYADKCPCMCLRRMLAIVYSYTTPSFSRDSTGYYVTWWKSPESYDAVTSTFVLRLSPSKRSKDSGKSQLKSFIFSSLLLYIKKGTPFVESKDSDIKIADLKCCSGKVQKSRQNLLSAREI